ncbi:MAG TPA: hypothetical protein P5531_14770 [Bacteroidales bacterium]|nr:hypothetical protein [Bacteroidales bacterium]HSA44867.1 hypothetical protein [Bacteroidales bacterium]
MRNLILTLLGCLSWPLFAQFADLNEDGCPDPVLPLVVNDAPESSNTLLFNQFWVSAPGQFSNCWDGLAGYFDGDTLLDLAGYTFTPNQFYIYEQVAGNPDSFALVFTHVKTEAGGFGPLASGDTDGDDLREIIVADLSTMSRIYIFECTGDNQYVSQNTQNTLFHTNDGYTARFLKVSDMNKNESVEIICGRGTTSGGMVRIWEHAGSQGVHTYSELYTYQTPSYLYGTGGIGDSDGDGRDEVIITYGGTPASPLNIRRIVFDSLSNSFQHMITSPCAKGIPASAMVKDLNNDGDDELLVTCNSNGKAAFYVFKYQGNNQYQVLDSVFILNDLNNLLTCDAAILTGNPYPAVLCGSYNGAVYIYQYNGNAYTQEFMQSGFGGSAVRRVYFTQINGMQSFFNTWSSNSSNGNFYLFTSDLATGLPVGEEGGSRCYAAPNPMTEYTGIRFHLKRPGMVTLQVFDTGGKCVIDKVAGQYAEGEHEITLTNGDLSPGLYQCIIRTAYESFRVKLVHCP